MYAGEYEVAQGGRLLSSCIVLGLRGKEAGAPAFKTDLLV